jgi:hypothetical protein
MELQLVGHEKRVQICLHQAGSQRVRCEGIMSRLNIGDAVRRHSKDFQTGVRKTKRYGYPLSYLREWY